MSTLRERIGKILPKDKWMVFAIAAALFIGLCILFSGGVYRTVPSKGPFFWKVNKFTGKTYMVRFDKEMEVEERHFVDDMGLTEK